MWIYLTTNKINGKMYVGRNSRRAPNYYGSGNNILQAIEKYGIENFELTILEDLGPDCSLREAIDCEKKWIEHFQAPVNPMFYNISWNTGGMGKGDTHSEETRKVLSEKQKKICEANNGLPPEWKNNVIEAIKGRIPWNKGKKKEELGLENAYKTRKRKRKFTQEEIIEIKAEYGSGIPAYKVAKKWDTSHHTILSIVRKDESQMVPKKERKKNPHFTEEHKKKISESVKKFYQQKKDEELCQNLQNLQLAEIG
jgi:group I intron endonuclease